MTTSYDIKRLAHELTRFAEGAALEVAPYLRAAVGTVTDFSTKKDHHDPVTIHDRAVEGQLHRYLGATVPGSRVLGEELGEQTLPASVATESLSKSASFLADRVRWILDPIDGTANFATGNHYFGTSIGIELDGRIVGGVVSMPMLSEVVAADLDQAWLLDSTGERTSIRSVGPATEATAIISSYYPTTHALTHKTEAAMERFSDLTTAYMGIRRFGAGAVDLAQVACGRLSCLLGTRFAPWDVAAGAHIVTIAGGHVINLPLGTSHPEGLRPGILANVGNLEATVARRVLNEVESEAH